MVVCFIEFFTLFTLAGRNVFISNPFLTNVTVSNVPRGGVQVFFGHQKQWSPPLGSGWPWALKCLVINRSTLQRFYQDALTLSYFNVFHIRAFPWWPWIIVHMGLNLPTLDTWEWNILETPLDFSLLFCRGCYLNYRHWLSLCDEG